ncbi:MAG: hypothetical protein QOH36_2308 [Actinomycetota bacterium]|nr:hypothetical protein [Actinomycetota bacterium]
MQLRHRMWLVTAAVVLASLLMPTLAWAKYRATGAETNTFATLTLGTPGTPACIGLGVLSVTLSWTAASGALRYDLGVDNSPGGPFTYSDIGSGTTETFGISSGTFYYVVRPANHNWQGPDSAPRKVVGVLVLAATCPP